MACCSCNLTARLWHGPPYCAACSNRRRSTGRALGAGRPVILTREAGKNEELGSLLNAKGIKSIAIPLVRSVDGPERYRERSWHLEGSLNHLHAAPASPAHTPRRHMLVPALEATRFDWICLTSPQAARVFAAEFKSLSTSAPGRGSGIACVGSGTAKVLEQQTGGTGITSFVPSVVRGR